jgi:hypothetical protein
MEEVRLDRLCIADFIDISCGEYGSLAGMLDMPSTSEGVKKVAADLIMQYRSIADPVGLKMYIGEHGGDAKARAKMLVMSLAAFVVEYGDKKDRDEVREYLASMGKRNATKMSDEALLTFVKNEERSVRFSIERSMAKKTGDKAQSTPEEIRKGFDAEIAFVMSHYKMSIDTRVVSASVYANLVKNAVSEVKRMKNQTKK